MKKIANPGSALAQMRWDGKSKEERAEVVRQLNEARLKKMAARKKKAKLVGAVLALLLCPQLSAQDPPASPPPYAVACWGDSLTAGDGGGTAPCSMLRALLPGLDIHVAGVGGETSSQIALRKLADRDHVDWFTIIWAGGNDMRTPETIKANIADMVAGLSPARFLIVGVINGDFPSLYVGQPDYAGIRKLNADLAESYPGNFLDIRAILVESFDPTVPQDVLDHAHDVTPGSIRADRVHLTAGGYGIVAREFARVLRGSPGIAKDLP